MSRPASPLRDVPIERHGVVGDRRTAALVAADGTVDWLCLPDYDGVSVFGALLDADRRGFCRLGPATAAMGRQRYGADSCVLVTRWSTEEAELELADAMAWPWDDRGEVDGGGDARVLLRRLRCRRGAAACALTVRPRRDFDRAARTESMAGGVTFDLGDTEARLWANRRVDVGSDCVSSTFGLAAGEEVWVVLASGDDRGGWTVERAERELDRADRYWRDWLGGLAYDGPRHDRVCRAALTLHLLS